MAAGIARLEAEMEAELSAVRAKYADKITSFKRTYEDDSESK